jgi:phosphate transport system protein
MSRTHFQNELERLMQALLRLGAMVADALRRALDALLSSNTGELARVVTHDRVINAAVVALHERCRVLIIREQPVAGDLREIAVVWALLPEFERMADHAATICKVGLRIAAQPGNVPVAQMVGSYPATLAEMGSRVLGMLTRGLDALVHRNAAAALQLAQDDDAVDQLYRHLFEETVALPRTQPAYCDEAIHLLMLAHNLERIGDRVTNVAEQVIYLLRGEVVALNG